MRRRRRHLEVSTFPFLAVLLCTMGSLILLLLVLDRRAKIAAQRKAINDFALVRAEKGYPFPGLVRVAGNDLWVRPVRVEHAGPLRSHRSG